MTGWKFLATVLGLGALACILAQQFMVASGIGGPRGGAAWGFGAMVMLLASAIVAIRGLRREL